MTTIQRNAVVFYSTAKMFALVDAIEAYPEFLPWCSASHVVTRTETEVCASLTLAWKGMEKSFTTRNRLYPHNRIELGLVDGPFRHLEGNWLFEPLDEDSCKITLDLTFEFSNKLLGFAFGSVFSQVANTLVDAFCERAEQVYGKVK